MKIIKKPRKFFLRGFFKNKPNQTGLFNDLNPAMNIRFITELNSLEFMI